MPRYLGKTPSELFKNANVISDTLYHPFEFGKKGLYPVSEKRTAEAAQKAANEESKIIDYADKKHKIHSKWPQQWKYKTGTELATAMTRAAKYDPDDERSWGPSPYARQVEDIWDEIYSAKMEEPKKID